MWCVLGTISNIQFSLSVLGTVIVGEYALYELLPVQSVLNVFKYLNIFAYVHTSRLYTEYLNVDLFGFPVGIRELSVTSMAVLGTVLAVLAVLIQRNRRPEGKRDVLSRISSRINLALDFFRTRFSIGAWEVYKSLIFQYGIIILLVILAAAGRLSFISYNTSPQDQWYLAYVRDMEGILDENADKYLAHAWESIPEGSEDAGALMGALSKVEYRVTELRERAERGGYEPWILEDSTYDQTYGPQSQNLQRLNAAAAIILTAFFCVNGSFAFERQSGVVPMVRATKRGRKGLLRRKVALTAVFATFVWAAVYMRELWTFLNWRQPRTLAAPVQN
ncbi:MAG: hypothetical protein K2K53_02450, partial [Oscillospiraceae bacterium]|nr:hypothetical protein [Oscillospiraceae bacterium]